MAYIGNQPASAFASTEKQTITGNGTAGPYALTHEVAAATDIACFVNNVRQEPGVAYTVSGNQMTMTGNVASTDDFYVVYIGRVVGTVNHPANAPLSATTGTFSGDLTVDTNTLKVDSTNNRLGIGTDSPSKVLDVRDNDATGTTTSSNRVALFATNGTGKDAHITFSNLADSPASIGNRGALYFDYNNTEAMRIDASRNLLVGTTSSDIANDGARLKPYGQIAGTADGDVPLLLNRRSSDGTIAQFRKDNAIVGSIGTSAGLYLYLGTDQGSDCFIRFVSTSSSSQLRPANNVGNNRDNIMDLGASNSRWDDIFATNGTIQTSDQNEKQDIASLTTAEMTAAKAISKLFKTFKWQDKVAAKGDAARTHTGVIAQEVQTAMTDAGLDAADYAFWCSNTFWEADGETYDTTEEAPDGATQRTRLGIRYPELLAFIGAATEQRLADLETRLTALEAADGTE